MTEKKTQNPDQVQTNGYQPLKKGYQPAKSQNRGGDGTPPKKP